MRPPKSPGEVELAKLQIAQKYAQQWRRYYAVAHLLILGTFFVAIPMSSVEVLMFLVVTATLYLLQPSHYTYQVSLLYCGLLAGLSTHAVNIILATDWRPLTTAAVANLFLVAWILYQRIQRPNKKNQNEPYGRLFIVCFFVVTDTNRRGQILRVVLHSSSLWSKEGQKSTH